MGFFSIFKTPINETLGVICGAYKKKLNLTNDSKLAFVELANEAYIQLRKHQRSNFSSPSDTYRMLSGKEFNDLSKNHSDNKEYLQYYLFNMMMYIRPDYYKPEDYNKNERLKVLIDTNLNY
ncbi:hypothetical protein [Polynucleobacter rarus]|uniref:hypothetical protein n=1 Tax=Polynucleobacter rarus TaxID=556055 RepID=UPI000D3E436B|nr:hypothetical protein [Polynucleobacter rarus]